jgi:hypothetical protein
MPRRPTAQIKPAGMRLCLATLSAIQDAGSQHAVPTSVCRTDARNVTFSDRVVKHWWMLRGPSGPGNFFRARLYNLSAGVQCGKAGCHER